MVDSEAVMAAAMEVVMVEEEKEAVTAVDLAEVVKEAGSVVDLEEAMEEDSVAVTEVATEVATEVDSEAAKADLAPARKTPRPSLLSYHERKKKPRALH